MRPLFPLLFGQAFLFLYFFIYCFFLMQASCSFFSFFNENVMLTEFIVKPKTSSSWVGIFLHER